MTSHELKRSSCLIFYSPYPSHFLSVWRLAANFVLVWLETAIIGRVVSFDSFTVFKVIFIINWVDYRKLATVKNLKAELFERYPFVYRSYEGFTFETMANLRY